MGVRCIGSGINTIKMRSGFMLGIIVKVVTVMSVAVSHCFSFQQDEICIMSLRLYVIE
jgi:hypothetical protein